MQEGLKFNYIESDSYDPWRNLAYEEYLLNNLKEKEVILYLWQNARTVVIGVNQNPWKECDVTLLEKEEGKLARRLSGGGAVYHDLGNLNFTFIVRREYYDFQRQVKVIIDALKELGINAEFTGRNDILVNNKKISGNAFYFRNNGALHHGTILVNCDFYQLTKYLNVSKEKIQSKGIESVRSRVINLNEVNSAINIDMIKESLKNQFRANYGSFEQIYCKDLDNKEIKTLIDKYSSWEWRFGDTPKFEVSLTKRFGFGEVDINLNLDKGIILEAIIYSDAMDPDIAKNIEKILVGVPLNKISSRMNDKALDTELKEWLISELENL